MQEFDFIVIGGGSAGLKAARTAAKLGRKVALAEERELGGECFWAGCVPTKAMVRAADVWTQVRHSGQYGIHTDVTKADFSEAMDYKNRVVKQLGGDGPDDGGLSKIGASYYPVQAKFESPHEVRMGEEVISGKCILIATGTVPAVPPIPGLEEVGYITNREAVHLETLPKRLVVLGAGPIGLEFAQIFRRFGAAVTVLGTGSQVLPKEDEQIAELAAQYLRDEGIEIYLNASAGEVSRKDGAKRVHFEQNGEVKEIDCDEILVATGRDAALEGLNIEAAGVSYEKRCVHVDKHLRTNVPHILAAGDIAGGYLFTHVASYEGRLVAMNAFTDQPEPFDHRVVPRCTYIDPEVASIGLTEKEAEARGADVSVYDFSFADLDRAVIYGDPRGMVKIVADALNGLILGAHVIGPDASSVIAELAICMRHNLPVRAIADTMHAYPSFPEAIEAAALSAPNFRGQVEGVTG